MKALFPPFNAESSLEFLDVSLSRGDNILFSNLSVKLSPGEVLYVQGANGIGKTSLLRLAIGFAVPDAGSVIWKKGHQDCLPSQIIAYQGHHDAFKDVLSTEEELSFWTNVNDYKGSLPDVFAAARLSDQSSLQTGKLSAGQKRRLSLARLIVSRKPIWIMDEPSAAMDDLGLELIDAVISHHITRGGSVMIASHMASKPLSMNTRRLTLNVAA